MKKNIMLSAAVLAVAVCLLSGPAFAGATRVAAAIWAKGQLYDTVVTPATFIAPPEHSTDIIYSFMMSGLEGQRSVAEAAPGDRDYNGGRWDVQMAVFTEQGLLVHDPDGDGMVNFELTSAEDVEAHVQLGHIVINDANFYFECPLLPRRGR